MARGRPVSFDKDEILETTLHAFWHAGYLGTSYKDLCAVTGLTKPSLYGAFGNKEETFLETLELYLERNVRPGLDLLSQKSDPREGLLALLIATVDGLTADGTPPGCMIAANVACAAAPDIPGSVAAALISAAQETPSAIFRRLSDAKPRELPSGTSPASLALFYEAVITGLSGLARQGASREELLAVVETSMQIWAETPRT